MSDPKVFIFAPVDQADECHQKLEKYGCDLLKGQAGWHSPQGDNEQDMVGMAKEADALMGTSIRSSPITRTIMESSPNLRVVAKCTVGTDDIDVDAATELGILVCHAPTESNCYGVAEGTVAFILATIKKLNQRDAAVKSGGWRDPGLMGQYLGRRTTDDYPGLTLGLIGLGRIGARVAQLFAPWRMRIIACDPYIDDERFIRNGVERVDMDTLLAESDIVSMHCVNTKETSKLMDAEKFGKMKPSSIFVNTSRGANVDEAALADALENDVIAAAAIDAFADEPIDTQSRLKKLGDKVILSPHMVSSNQASGLGPGYIWATNAVLQALAGEVPNNVFNPEVIERWKERFGGTTVITANEPVPDHPGYGPLNP
jgi:D-3-phosphoglycerate dehydrogenase / 2-oxoglutarate reductase